MFSMADKKSKLLMLQKMKDSFTVIHSQLISVKAAADYYFLVLENCIAYCEQMINLFNGEDFASSAIRDRQMALNILWLAKHTFKSDKIIVWAANSHIIKNFTPAFKKSFRKPPSMGSFIKADPEMGTQSFFLGFTGYSGETGRATTEKKYNIKQPRASSLESWLKEAGHRNCFVNFIPLQNNTGSFSMNCFNWYQLNAGWQHYYDGMIYLEKTEPCIKNFPVKG